MKRVLSLVLALTLALGLAVVPASAAQAQVFRPSVSPGLTETETTLDTGIPGMTLTLGADEWSVTALDIPMESASGVSYQSFLTGKANPKTAEGKGTYFSFTFDDSVKTGALELMYRLNSGKAFYIMDNGEAMDGFDGTKLEVSADTSTTLIVQGGHTYTVYASGSKLRLYGCAFQNVEPQEVFAAEIAAFPFDRVKGTNADALHVDEDLALMDSYESQFGSCDVSWTSSDPSVVDVNGAVSCQKTETQVELTGHFSVQENRALAADVTFTLTVLADPDDTSAVAVAKEVLTLGDTSSVKRDLELPTVGKRGCAIAWKSSDQDVVGDDGRVYPAADVDQKAILTATITRGQAVDAKTFEVTVAGIVPVELNAWSYVDAEGHGVYFTPVDGGKLALVNLTCNDPNPDPGDVATITVYAADGTRKASRELNLVEYFTGVPVGESVCIGVGLPMDSGDYFELTATSSDGVALIRPVRNDDTLADTATVYVVGDSTASVYGDDRYPRKGWAQMLGGYFDGVEVVDLALSGRSSRSFKDEANYQTLKNSLKKGDYLIIQFGHNDNKADAYADPEPDYHTALQDPTSFQSSMLEYIQLAWEKGAKPVVATSISRRKLSDAELEKYVLAARTVSATTCTPCIDLYGITNAWINQVGVDAAQDMFNCVKPHDSRFVGYAPFAGSEFYEKGSTDDTHLNLYGADLIAQWFVDLMAEQGLPLAAKVNDRRAAALPSYAQATDGAAAVSGYADVTAGDWFAASVQRTTAAGVFSGTGDGRFQPGQTMTRAMVATVLYRLAGSPAAQSVQKFPDVSADAWYAAAAAWAGEKGIVAGYESGVFAPDDPITREQLAIMVFRFALEHGLWSEGDVVTSMEDMPAAYPDFFTAGDWAAESLQWLTAKGLLTGKPGGLLDPKGQVTRAEAAVILDRLMTLMGK